ncbi:hypothetical protein P10VF_133 [Rhizobium phage vB_RleM_P10VF]|uniref:Uncharacterized protein n=1 Tax=Rhizobium phage vB_RleM_P10VF TaxID=1527770 RepID=A0A076YQ83_9CAUD|nr:hypothetical protein P10VF_133 [Rhizobium phage vB_RleM_P10VF]AIK68346.1 hypothetical protein P10VF_133 [Rhizobium phage vB_RleM_P10VF]
MKVTLSNGSTFEFTQDDINSNSSMFNCEQKVPVFGSEDWVEALVEHLFDVINNSEDEKVLEMTSSEELLVSVIVEEILG